ncbi:MAG TPA: hypothetical protein DEP84_10160 [Chloroflexi bacterium]|nr:hypothetical protein [Chloroflexota bacterium]
MLSWYVYPLAVLAGFAAGFINTLAGSGSLITLPLLIFMGLPANVANGTNRVGVLLQTAAGVEGFRRQGVLHVRSALWLALPAVLGSILGARIAVNLDERTMERVIGVIMLIMLVVILVRPQQWLEGHPGARIEGLDWKQFILFFAIGVYGGFIQAGVGIFLLAGLVLGSGFDLVRANGVKNLIVFIFTFFALAVFVLNGQVVWSLGLIVSVGQVAGAWFGAHFAVEKGAVWVRRLLIVVIVVSIVRLLGVNEWIVRL